MTTILPYIIQVTSIDILEISNVKQDQNTGEEPMNLLPFKNTKVKTVIYLVEMDVFSNVLTIFSTKTSACNISNSYNHIKEEQML